MKSSYDVIIAGGGLAGLINSIELADAGFSVLVIEKKSYPFHKVCGEYISNEVKQYLKSKEIFPFEFTPPSISRLMVSSPNGSSAKITMRMGGFGISRFSFDEFLFTKASERGVDFLLNSSLYNVHFSQENFRAETLDKKIFTSRVFIGAYGKRSSLDRNLKRSFLGNRTEYLAVKQHFKADYPEDLVSLHNFEGGYCGISTVENAMVNVCYLTNAKMYKTYSNQTEFERHHMSSNPHLKAFFKSAEPQFSRAQVISQLHFGDKEIVKDHILMCGDAAGMIHPLCGNGMAMAIQSARLCSNQVKLFLRNRISRTDMEWNYTIEWEHQFERRLKFGRVIQKLFGRKRLSNIGIKVAGWSPVILSNLIKLSHGREMNVCN